MPDLVKLHNLAGSLREKREQAKPSGHRWFDIRNASEGTTAVYIYDMIGEDGWGGGLAARDFVNELSRVRTPAIEVHIASEGGDVFDGIAIYEALKQHPAKVDVIIDSLAASAASFIAMAGDTVKMTRRARMMLHDAAIGGAFGAGTALDMREFAQAVTEMADLLDDLSLNIAGIYADRAGGTPEQWRARMQAGTDNSGTWFSAEAAKEAGLIDGIVGEEDVPALAAESTTIVEDSVNLDALRAAIEGAFSA